MGQKIMVLDTETTGLAVEDGDRIIEVGIVEMDGLTPTGRTFHHLVDPGDRQILAGATMVHGITNAHLTGKPSFADIADDMLDFIGDAPIVIYNASFDIGFLNEEMRLCDRGEICNEVIDALQIARRRFPRKRHTLDAVAKHLGVDTSARSLHGALIDANILADVYRRLVQQDELAIAEVASAIVSNTTIRHNAKPILKAANTQIKTLPRCESSYTLFGSALKAEAIPELALACGWEAVALVDKLTTAGAMSFGDACKKKGIKGIVGVALPITSSEGRCIVLYARDATGWNNIQRLVTVANVDMRGQGLNSKQLAKHAEGVLATCGGADGAITHILRTKGAEAALKTARYLSVIYPGAFAMEIDRHDGAPDHNMEAGVTEIAHEIGVPVIATRIARSPRGRANLVEVLKAIGSGHEYQPDMADGEDMRTPDDIASTFRDIPDAVENANWLASLCDFTPVEAKPMLPRYEGGDDEAVIIDSKAKKGLVEQLRKIDPSEHHIYWTRYEYEMGLIRSQGFSGYFLIVADFIAWAKSNGIPVGPGRGSGAGSIVAWSLGITQLDPIKLKLMFERFINPDRVSLPDFDVDFCEERRGEVIRYVRNKYGSDRVAAIGAYQTIKAKTAIKDVGRVMGLPYGLTDRISKAIPNGEQIAPEMIASPEIQQLLTTPASREALGIAQLLQGLIRSKSRHPAGIIIADRPVSEIASLEPDADEPDQAVTQYDMKPVEKVGLVKFDFLGLRTLTVIEQTRKNLLTLGITLDPYELNVEDPETYAELSRGNTTGVFQLESDGITRACRDIRVDNFEDIIAIVSLYRPGPMEFIPLYARRKKGMEPFGTPHPLLDDVARETYGILVYQEQVMQAAQVLAGYTLGQADLLRRAMGKKIQAEMDVQRSVFVKGCLDTNGIDARRANELFDLIDKFAGYGFNRSHAAAYALLSFITAYLRTHHPAAYLAAALDGANSNGDTEQVVRLAHEARRYGIELMPPQLVADGGRFRPLNEKTIRWSLSGIKGIGPTVVDAVTRGAADRPYADISDFVARVGDVVNKSNAMQMAAAGVLDELCAGRQAALNSVRDNYDGLTNEARSLRRGQASLFGDDLALTVQDVEIEGKEILDLERAAIGMTLSSHPIDEHSNRLSTAGILTPSAAEALLDSMPVAIAALIDEVRVGKNRNAWMTIRASDARSTVTLGCQEDLPNAHMLRAGEVLVMRVSGQISNGERRLRIDEIVGPATEIENGRTLIINLAPGASRDIIRNLLQDAVSGTDRVRIVSGDEIVTTPRIVTADNVLLERVLALDEVDSASL